MAPDPEIAAVVRVAQALADLDSATCRRVLTWAQERYVESHRFQMDDFDNESFLRFTGALNEAARKLGNVAAIDILRFVEYVDELRKKESNEGAASE